MRSDANRFARLASPTAAAALLALAAFAGAAGCSRTTLERSVVDDRFGDEQAFWTDLETRRVVTNNDALHGFFITADGADPNPTYEDRLAAARERGWITDAFQPDSHPANESATVGELSVVACRIADIKGGLTMRLLGPTPRYAAKELVYMEILPDRADNQSMSGLEFIDFVARVQDRIRPAGEGIVLPPAEHGEPAPPPPPDPAAPDQPGPVPDAPTRPQTASGKAPEAPPTPERAMASAGPAGATGATDPL